MKNRIFSLLLLLMIFTMSANWSVFAKAIANPITERVSVASDGTEANHASAEVSFSADGQKIAFDSFADNLVENDTNGTLDSFIHDRETGQTRLVSVASDGMQANGYSGGAQLDAEGRLVAFLSEGTNLVFDDTNGQRDVFVHDLLTSQTTRVSLASDGTQANAPSRIRAISANGQFVVFESRASNLVPNDTNDELDVFVHDRDTGQTTRVSLANDGSQADDYSARAAISGDGRYVAFVSDADNLTENDTNYWRDVFVRDRLTGQTRLVSISSDGQAGNYDSYDPAISADGRFVAFASQASNFVENDTNDYCLEPGGFHPNCHDVFVHDLLTSQTTRISIAFDGQEGNSLSGLPYLPPAISADGRLVAFWSYASNLVENDTNQSPDGFVYDRLTNRIERVSVASDGTQAESQYDSTLALAERGRLVAFHSSASNLVKGDTNNLADVFVRDRGQMAMSIPLYLPLVRR